MKLRFFITPLCLLLSATLTHSQAQPSVSVTPRGAGNYDIDWAGVAGRSYFMQFSTDLVNWSYAPSMDYGAGAKRRGANSNSDKLFVRLPYVDDPSINSLAAAEAADFDRDGISNLAELTSASPTNPLNSAEPNDSDGDRMPNAWEVRYGLNPANPADAAADANGDGITNLQSYLNGVSPIGGGGNPATPIEPELVGRGVSTHCYRWGSNDFQFDIQYYSKSLIALNEAKLASHTEQSFSSGFPGIGYGLLSSVSGENSDTMDLDFLLHGTKEGIALVAGLFPIPAISTNEDFSLWKKMDAQRSGVNEFVLGNSSQAAPNSPNEDPEDTSLSKSVSIHHQFALRLKEPAQQAITQTGTFLRVIRKSNVTTLLNPPTQNMEFTIKAGEKASNVIDIHGPIPDTAPEAGIEKRAYLLPVDLDIVHPATGELAEDREDGTSSSPDGGYVSVKRTVGSDVVGDDDVTPITKLKIHAIAGAQSTWKTRVKFSGADRYIIYKNEDRTEEVISEQTEFDATQTTTLYLQGLKKSLSRGGESIMMQVKVGNDWVDGDSVKCTIVQSEFLIQIRAFIPYEWTEGESLWLINGVNPMNGKVAQGDDREATLQFKNVFSDKDENFSVAPYRLCHEVILTPYPALHYFYQDIEPERKFSSAPTSDHYNKATSVNPSEMAQRNGYADLLSSPIASGPPVVFPPTYAPYLLYYNSLRPNKCGLDLTASGKDGAMGIFTAASPAIDWDIGLEIDASIDPLQPRIRALGKHDLYPAYEIIVLQSDGSFKDIHRHMPNRDVYPGPISLSTAPSVDFDNTRIITQ